MKSLARLRASAAQLWEFARPGRKTLYWAVGLGIFASLTALAQPLAVGYVITEVSAGRSLARPVVLLVALFLTDALLSGMQSYLLGVTGEGIVLGLRRTLIGRLMRLPIPAHDRFRSGDLLSRVNTDTTLLQSALTSGFTNVVSGSLTFVGAVVLMAYLDPLMLGVALVCILTAAVLVTLVSFRVRKVTQEAQQSLGRLGAALDRALGAIRTVKLSGAEDRETRGISREAEAAYDAGVKSAKLTAVVEPATSIAINGSFVLVLGIGGVRLASGSLSVAELVSFLLYLSYLVMPLGMVFMSITDLQRGLAAVERINGVLDLPVEDGRERVHTTGDTPDGEGIVPVVRFDSVSFGYTPDRRVLEDVSFEVPAFSQVALVGPSGAGKSTIFSLIERFYEADSGTVSFNGRDVGGIPLGQLRGGIGYVEQDSPVMAGTIRENLLYAKGEATDDEIREILRLTNLTDFIGSLPDGMESEVGDDGVLLSGGERQRIAIARMLLLEPSLLLLDEATSNLDARNERALRETVSRITERRSVMVIAHRLSTVVDADSIVVLKDGEVSGTGTHEELMDSNDLYRELATSQLVGRY